MQSSLVGRGIFIVSECTKCGNEESGAWELKETDEVYVTQASIPVTGSKNNLDKLQSALMVDPVNSNLMQDMIRELQHMEKWSDI